MSEIMAYCSAMWSNRTSTINNYPKVAESEIIETNYLGFAKSLFQQYSQQLGLNNNYFSVESAFNFYINDKITDCLRGTVNIKSARENFYTELFQHTSLPRNYSFAPIIREINQTIERYTQQQFPITYTDKGKGRLQTPAVTPKQIQLLNWKKTQVESPTHPSYYYMPRSAINISLTDMFTSNVTSTFGCFSFQSKQQKAELLGPYNFRNMSLWEITESEKEEEEESEDQEFTYQNPIIENSEFGTPNFQTQQNSNLENLELETPNIQPPPN
ncbi:hypothetical protein G9A89_017100 [Geosiphon pyriformis]|nr:hypothetical protein G9A89_017100 [Geosiphon pyriformis]